MEYNRVQAEVDLAKMATNVKIIRKEVTAKAKIMAVVKADGYGHGAVETAKTVIRNGADWLGVAICEEGVELREQGIDAPILLLGYTPEIKMAEAIEYNLTQTVYSYEVARKLSEVAKAKGKTATIHIKIDTGMSRLGYIESETALKEIKAISRLEHIRVTGMYTHLADAEVADKAFSYEQRKKFLHFLSLLEKDMHTGIKHISNSAAVADLRDFDMDMVRVGISLYGLATSGSVKPDRGLQPALSLKTHVSLVKELAEGVSVGYGRTYFTQSKTKVATIPVGYADGYPRYLSNRGRVLVNGNFAKVIGNICMDQFMIDVTHIENVQIDDEVVLIGEQGGHCIAVEEWAALGNTINHEIICGIGKRVPRIY